VTTEVSALPFTYGKRLDDLEVLARSPLLGSLPIQDLSQLFELLDQVALPSGTCVFREGDTADLMYFVLEGEARLRRGSLELRPLRAGDSFGEAALLAASPRSFTVETHGTVRLARLSRSRYLSFVARHPRAALHLTQALAGLLANQVVDLTDDVGLIAHQRSAPRHTHVHVQRGSDALVVPTGTLVGTLLSQLDEDTGAPVVGGLVNHRTASLEYPIVADATLSPATPVTADGRAIVLRSVALLVLEAARTAAMGIPLRMGPTIDVGQIVVVEASDVDREALARRVSGRIAALRTEDIPLREEVWSTDEARVYFAQHDASDVAALLLARRDSTVTVATCGETLALGMGPLLPRASLVGPISVEPHPAGLLVSVPELTRFMPLEHGGRVDPVACERRAPRYGGPMTTSQRRWLEGLGITSAGTYATFCIGHRVPELIRVAEGFHEKWLGRIVDAIVSRRNDLQVIAIAGPSSSGKTTFIKRLTVQLLVEGINPVALSLDDYYVDREKTLRDENGEYDFEAFEALDASLLREQTKALLAREAVRVARYDFVAGKSAAHGGRTLQMNGQDVLLVEGIHGLDPALLDGVVDPSRIYRVFVHPATTLAFDRASVLAPDDLRLLRRIVRDRHQRNYDAAATIARWPSVRSGELRRIYPFLANADVVFDSALVYEPSILKTYAERYLLEVPLDHPSAATAYRLRKMLDPFITIYPDHVPPTSVIREFIGGSGFEY
jgi:uridine kinase